MVSFPFKTGQPVFDKLNESSGMLNEYLAEDILGNGDYTTYIFTEKRLASSRILVLGMIRFKEETIEKLQETLDNLSMDEKIKYNIMKDILDYRPKIFYLSRIGVQEDQKQKRVGTLMARFFDFLLLREQGNVVVYTKVMKNLDIFLSGPYFTIGSGCDVLWGDYIVKYRVMFH